MQIQRGAGQEEATRPKTTTTTKDTSSAVVGSHYYDLPAYSDEGSLDHSAHASTGGWSPLKPVKEEERVSSQRRKVGESFAHTEHEEQLTITNSFTNSVPLPEVAGWTRASCEASRGSPSWTASSGCPSSAASSRGSAAFAAASSPCPAYPRHPHRRPEPRRATWASLLVGPQAGEHHHRL